MSNTIEKRRSKDDLDIGHHHGQAILRQYDMLRDIVRNDALLIEEEEDEEVEVDGDDNKKKMKKGQSNATTTTTTMKPWQAKAAAKRAFIDYANYEKNNRKEEEDQQQQRKLLTKSPLDSLAEMQRRRREREERERSGRAKRRESRDDLSIVAQSSSPSSSSLSSDVVVIKHPALLEMQRRRMQRSASQSSLFPANKNKRLSRDDLDIKQDSNISEEFERFRARLVAKHQLLQKEEEKPRIQRSQSMGKVEVAQALQRLKERRLQQKLEQQLKVGANKSAVNNVDDDAPSLPLPLPPAIPLDPTTTTSSSSAAPLPPTPRMKTSILLSPRDDSKDKDNDQLTMAAVRRAQLAAKLKEAQTVAKKKSNRKPKPTAEELAQFFDMDEINASIKK